MMTVLSGTGFTPGEYHILSVTVPVYTALIISSDDPTMVTDASRSFTDFDVGLELTITGGDGFAPGTYVIDSVADGVATLDAAAGAAGSVGGQATGTPSAHLDAVVGDVGSTDGHAIVGLITVYDPLGTSRALGTDDIGDAITHLSIDDDDPTIVYNESEPFT